ncbi:MAG TPA: tripartite tricarboxylate transporter substrate binding protein [Xanthobacteraceae bacterium]|nr:tripartite tricarboxylate transporter substrate binding protein [Xanthobacteraceae bacterium]
MKLPRRKFLRLSAGAAALPFAPHIARAQAYPTRPVRLIVPFPAGGGADTIARLVGGRLSEMWGQQLVVENRGGAGGNIASEAAARSAPDGYTLYLAGEFHSTNLFTYPKLSYDPIADFAPVSLVVQYPTVIVVPSSSPAKTVSEFITHAKANGGKLTMATPGYGTGPHLAGELFKREAGIQLTHVPYRGAAPALQDVIAGRVDSFFNNIAPVMPLINDGKVRALAVTTAKRTPAAPDIPTVAESGMPGFDVPGWYAFFVPAGTPPEIVQKMNADTVATLAEPRIKTRLEELGLVVIGSTPNTLGGYLKSEMTKWGPVIREANIRINE